MIKTCVLAGGCFWGVEELFRKQKGVVKTRVGYTGGTLENPTYEDVKKGHTGHAEAIEVSFDDSQTNYKNIFHYFFSIHDPTTLNQQGNDIGSQYRSAIFYNSDEEKRDAFETIEEVKQAGFWQKPIQTEVIPLKTFYSAEEYHQDYLQKNPGGYTCHFERY
ncbi:MAG: peptide-methionine (S)-S-oxide reductase MsrA [Bdellovibrionales bacterium]|nr:peptide-methionine (S)-S-oxide reductase MsrA [Bdellovibrionales bacterium]